MLVFPRGGSIVFQVNMDIVFPPEKISLCIVCECKQIVSESWNIRNEFHFSDVHGAMNHSGSLAK